MVVIRQQQIRVLEEYMVSRFEDSMLHLLKEHFERSCSKLGNSKVRELLRKGIEKAEGYGIGKRSDVARYIALMFILSHDFDTNPRFQWAAAILGDGKLAGTDKMDILFDQAREKSVTNSGNQQSNR
jgi:hypothetical protein